MYAGIGEACTRFAEEGAGWFWPISTPAGRATWTASPPWGRKRLCASRHIEGGPGPASPTRRSRHGRIDILVNNAADFTQKSVENADFADRQRVLGNDRPGLVAVAIPFMKAKAARS